ncbi:class I SAM-dependent methyltransferase [uncultured Chitinophaga sp.]|uniref:class I SAM-dependent methyltransferase n=1 Tax=uncultured Chitinophaga sp. TaxID=339340 RepID=UPI0025F2D4B0|nr:class I SAM-dependent methyltransferase [uncultured Chitinophaga sp.]
MNQNWIVKQALANVEQWDSSLTSYYPDTQRWMNDPEAYLQRLVVECNYLNAVKQLDWTKYLNPGSTVLDMGCGGGWLSAYLSAMPQVEKVVSIDSSQNYLDNFLPAVVQKLNGDISKIETIQGFFSPLMYADKSLDVLVISSALHHADNIASTMKEYERVLKPGGWLIILNETPASGARYIFSVSKVFTTILLDTVTQKYRSSVKKISAGGFLYDPYLGDVDYPVWYWKKAISDAGFKLEKIHLTGLATVVGKKGRELTHFICRKPA